MLRIITDSTASIPREMAKANNIEVVSMYLNRDGVEYVDATMDVEAFYRDIYAMVDNIPTSSQPTQSELEAAFADAARNGDDVLAIFMSSHMSGTVDSAVAAARRVAERYQGFTFRIVDSLSNSFDEAWSVLAAAAGRAAGKTIDECCEIAQKAIAASRFLFSPESLRFLKAGGRIGNAAALLGTIMKVCPIITVTDGKTTTFDKVRTHKKALRRIASQFKSDIEKHGLKNVVVHYIGSPDEARQWSREVIEPICGKSVDVIPVSPVIGLHVGPCVAVAYECEEPLPRKLSKGVSAPVYSS